jgi:AcrR family transcriptional regulator
MPQDEPPKRAPKGGAAQDKPKGALRARGRNRVATLLDAAAAVFVEKGFDLATMTEIAERANSSIGSLYQFFPSKEVLADTLRKKFGVVLCESISNLRADSSGRAACELADILFEIDLNVLRAHPSFAVLAVTRGRSNPELRARLVDELLALFALYAPNIPATELREIAIVTRQLLRASIEMVVEGGGEDTAGLNEMRSVLRLYLQSRLGTGRTDVGANRVLPQMLN